MKASAVPVSLSNGPYPNSTVLESSVRTGLASDTWTVRSANDMQPEEDICKFTLETCPRKTRDGKSRKGQERCPFTFEHAAACFPKNGG